MTLARVPAEGAERLERITAGWVSDDEHDETCGHETGDTVSVTP